MGWRRCAIALVVLLLACAVVVAVVHFQLPSHDLVAIQIPDRCCTVIGIGILEESIALRFAGFFVIDQSEADDWSYSTEDVLYLLFADAVGDVPDEDGAPTLFARRVHVVPDCRSSERSLLEV